MCEKCQNNNEKGNTGAKHQSVNNHILEFITQCGRFPKSPNELLQFMINMNITKMGEEGYNSGKHQEGDIRKRINLFYSIPGVNEVIENDNKDRFDKAVELATEDIKSALWNLSCKHGEEVIEQSLENLGFLIPKEDEPQDSVIIGLIERISELEGKVDTLGNMIQPDTVAGQQIFGELKEFNPTNSIRKIVRQEVKKEVNRRYGQVTDKK